MPLEKAAEIDKSLGLEPISIRLQIELVRDLKALAKKEGLYYQAFIRHILTKYVQRAHAKSKSNRETAWVCLFVQPHFARPPQLS